MSKPKKHWHKSSLDAGALCNSRLWSLFFLENKAPRIKDVTCKTCLRILKARGR